MNHPSAFSGLRAGAKAAAPGAPMRLGSGEHLSLFCRMLLDTHDPYRPAIMGWPALEKEARDRLVSLPIWDIAVQTEGRARLNVGTYAAGIVDPLLKQPVEMNAFEEGRHQTGYDGRLSRPSTVPALARCALSFMRSSRKDKHKRSSFSSCCGGS